MLPKELKEILHTEFVKYFENQSFDSQKACIFSTNGVIYLHHECSLQKMQERSKNIL